MSVKEAIKVLRSHQPCLYAAAIPTKSEVFVVCGYRAAEIHDAIDVVAAALARQEQAA